MKIRPLHDRVIVKRTEGEEKTKGGIIIPDTAKEKPVEGKVIAVGGGKVLDGEGGRDAHRALGGAPGLGLLAAIVTSPEGQSIVTTLQEAMRSGARKTTTLANSSVSEVMRLTILPV